MPVIELNVSDQVYLRWLDFRTSQQASRLEEAGVLGDWILTGFINNVNDYLKQGGPTGAEDASARRQRLEATARNSLSKPQKRVLPMFDENETVTLDEISRVLGITPEDGAALTAQWVEDQYLSPAPERDNSPTFTLSRAWRERNLAANRPSLHAPRRLHYAKGSKPGPNEI
ncbi:MAG: hypothetical protein K9K66_09395 [Desulfarculaceae bacterium]|nr:hypothetical protein [Desulfarculaceae bacterium]MCF8073053.1 hypothetical protein [Desulfarculaceae bacterium]MCF8101862.1 hypothetical protein [Desulfarculaceae bacterium]MCF8115389.1 hypothetical protein [Desulfarculaceae bacterium]